MIKIGLISDTHGFFDPKLKDFFTDCNEIWHAGDIGSITIAKEIELFRPLKAVYGNIDGQDVRCKYPKHLKFACEGVNVWLTHIGGYPGNYDPGIRDEIRLKSPDLFISGHSHICKIMPDKKLGLLYINPGAAGKTGFHNIRTGVRFVIDGNNICDLDVIELGLR
jgi:uncharacterized protein